MLRRLTLSLALALGPAAIVLACSGTVVIDGRDAPPQTALPVVPPPVTTAPPPDTAPCIAADQDCETDGDPCCAGLFCADTGYGFGTCRPPQPSGAYCNEGAECASGICHQYTCVDELPACVGLGEYCADGAPCCEGYCLPLGYTLTSGTCVPAQEAGSSCNDGSECASGICDLFLCRTAECTALGAECESDATCCTGFCTGGPYSYAPGACTAPQPSGSYCESWMWCASMSCIDGLCAP